MKSINLEKAIVLSDFDGTITMLDTNVGLCNTYGEEEIIMKHRNLYRSREIDLKTLFTLNFAHMQINEEEYLDYILNQVELQKGFDIFHNNLKSKGVPFAVVSAGFSTGIIPFLEKHGFKDMTIYANKLKFNGRDAKVKYYEEEHFPHLIKEEDYLDFKLEVLRKYKKEYDNIIFLGDGSTDIHAIKGADIIFAKDSLEKHCIEEGIPYIPWKDFHDVNKYFL